MIILLHGKMSIFHFKILEIDFIVIFKNIAIFAISRGR